jgi:hypothetical protein
MFDREAAREGLGSRAIAQSAAVVGPRLERVVAPATMGARGGGSGERLPSGAGQGTQAHQAARSIARRPGAGKGFGEKDPFGYFIYLPTKKDIP